MALPPCLEQHLRSKFTELAKDQLDCALREFERFVIIGLHSERFFFPCTKLIDNIWHEAILESREYHELCESITPGKFLHHSGMSHEKYMENRTVTEQDDEDLAVLASYFANFGPFDELSVTYWVVADGIRKDRGWDVDQLNTFLSQLVQLSEQSSATSVLADENIPQSRDPIRRFHKEHAGKAESYFSKLETSLAGKSTYQILADVIEFDFPQRSRILDVGCGIGSLYRPLAARFGQFEYIGLDQSPEEIEIARRRLFGIGATFVAGDARDIPYRDEYFSLIISHMALHIIPDHHRLFTELKRILAPKGLLYFAIPSRTVESIGEQAYADIMTGFALLSDATALPSPPQIFRDEAALIRHMKETFRGNVSKVCEYKVCIDPATAEAIDHFRLLYPYIALDTKGQIEFDDRASRILSNFAINNPGAKLERRMAIFQAAKG
jgi:ubiquinone/menaquinone biosynthesis C-methylase UbiE